MPHVGAQDAHSGRVGDTPWMKLSSGMKKLAAQSPTSTSSFRSQNLRGREHQGDGAPSNPIHLQPHPSPAQPSPAPHPCTRCGAEHGSQCWSAR